MADTLSNRAKFRQRVGKICSSRDLRNILKIHKKDTFSRASPIYGCEQLLKFMNQGVGSKTGRDLQNSKLPSPAPHGLASALKLYFHGFPSGKKRENCEEHKDFQLPPESDPDRESIREAIGHILKEQVLKRKMTQVGHDKREIFGARKFPLSTSHKIRALFLRGSAHSENLKRTPWQLLLHKGAPGSGLKTEFRGYDDAQLVPLPLLHILSSTTLEYRRALHRIVGLVSLPYIYLTQKIVELIKTCTQPMSVSYEWQE